MNVSPKLLSLRLNRLNRKPQKWPLPLNANP